MRSTSTAPPVAGELQIKAWRKVVWEDIGNALYKRRVSHQAMTSDEALAVDMFDGLVGQLKNAKAQTGQEPFFLMTKAASRKAIDEMTHAFWGKNVDPTMLFFNEGMLDDIITKLATDLGVPHTP